MKEENWVGIVSIAAAIILLGAKAGIRIMIIPGALLAFLILVLELFS